MIQGITAKNTPKAPKALGVSRISKARKALQACAFMLALGQGAHALEISTTFGKEAGQDFSVLSLRNDTPFSCAEVLDAYGKALSIECKISRIPDRGFPGLENSFFRLAYKMIDGDFWLYIYPKHQQKLFAIPKDPKEGYSLDKYPQRKAHLWQVVGYKKQIPFLSQESDKQGLLFPVKILGEQTPTIPELNTENRPLQATKNKDFEIYSHIKSTMAQQDYIGAITEINEALTQNPNSVFRRDLIYDRIIASSKLDLEDQDPLIESAQEWVRTFASDPDVPEILYILAAAYDKENIPTEAEYYYKRILNEYPESLFAPLAHMQLAKLAKINAPAHARIYFQRAYTEAKDIPSASEVALEWAIFELEQQHDTGAQELVGKVLQNYPRFFLDSPMLTNELMAALLDSEQYATAALVAQYLATNTKDPDLKEAQLFALGDYYAKAQDFEQAHKANQDYLQAYADERTPHLQAVQDRDDAILFAIEGGDEEKLKHYTYLMSKYPDTAEATKAKELSAKILLEKGKYQEVFGLYENDKQSPYRQQALDSMLKSAITQKDCKQVSQLLIQTTAYNLSPDEKAFAFDCADSAGLNTIAKQVAQGMVESSSDESTRLLWLHKVASNLYKLGEYQGASLAARDAMKLAASQKSHYDVAFLLFNILHALDSKDEAKKILPFLQEHFKDDERMLPVYAALLGYAIDEKDSMSTEVYASSIIALQKRYKSDEFTPYAEFSLANVLRESKRYEQAIALLKPLESKKLSTQDSAQLYYRIAGLLKLTNSAKSATSYLQKCVKIQGYNEWKTLCQQALELASQESQNSTLESKSLDSSAIDSKELDSSSLESNALESSTPESSATESKESNSAANTPSPSAPNNQAQ